MFFDDAISRVLRHFESCHNGSMGLVGCLLEVGAKPKPFSQTHPPPRKIIGQKSAKSSRTSSNNQRIKRNGLIHNALVLYIITNIRQMMLILS